MSTNWQELTSGVSAAGSISTAPAAGGGTIKVAGIQISIGQETASFTFTASGSSAVNVLQMFAASSNGVSAAIAITRIDYPNNEANIYYSIGSTGNQPASWTLGTIDLENS